MAVDLSASYLLRFAKSKELVLWFEMGLRLKESGGSKNLFRIANKLAYQGCFNLRILPLAVIIKCSSSSV